jgi:hypothetical protein
MEKTRTLGSDNGIDKGRWYNTGSSAPQTTAESRGWFDVGWLINRRRECMQLAASTMSFPKYVGSEYFYSSELKRPRFNNCKHSIVQAVNYAYTGVIKTSSTWCILEPYRRRYDARDPSSTVLLDRHISNVDASNAQRTAWGTMQPRYEGDVNLFVFLAELKDFKELARFLAKKPLRKLSNYFIKLKRKISKKSGNGLLSQIKRFDVTKPLAQAHLTNEFALKPLLSDIYSITCQMEVLASEAQKLFADAGRERSSRHYTEELFREDYDERSAYYQSKYPYILQGTSNVMTFTATMEYSYEYNLRNTLEAFMKYWGLVPNAEAIWELIPFSFLVDYFIKIGDSIRVASRDSNVHLNLSQYCESFLSYQTVGTHFKPSYLLAPLLVGDPMGNNPGVAPNGLVSGINASFYTRRVCRPNKGLALPRVAKPKSKQQLNMLALARCFL